MAMTPNGGATWSRSRGLQTIVASMMREAMNVYHVDGRGEEVCRAAKAMTQAGRLIWEQDEQQRAQSPQVYTKHLYRIDTTRQRDQAGL